MVDSSLVESRIRDHIQNITHLELRDLTGTQDHYEAIVVSADFAGKTRVEQHQMIYRALGDLMSGPVHALALTTYEPDAWNKKQGTK